MNLLSFANRPEYISISDGKGVEYFKTKISGKQSFLAGGATWFTNGQIVRYKRKSFRKHNISMSRQKQIYPMEAKFPNYSIYYIMVCLVYSPSGYEEVTWNGKTYRYFVNWVLDNNNTMKGMQYFSPYSRDLVDLFRENQKPDGMIWSFVQPDKGDYHYYETAYSYLGYFNRDKGAWFVRQPNENHVEYNYVNMIYQHWKASGDNEWMKRNLNCAKRALDFCITDTLHWSKRFQLLKRPYCIDSWDFQVDDEYTPLHR